MLVTTGFEYDPREFWNAKAHASGGDRLRAVCHDDPTENQNIDAVQRRLVTRALTCVVAQAPLEGRSLLDYGCGSGRWAPLLRGSGAAYWGVDLAEQMVELARQSDPTGRYHALENGRIPCPDHQFALVCSIAVLHHNPPRDQEKILEEILRVLAPDGHLLLFESVGIRDPNNPVEFARTRADWEALLSARGLESIWYEGARYFLLREAAERVLRHLPFRRAALRRVAERLGVLLDPLVGPVLPPRMHRRAAMVFRRTP